MRRAVAVAVVVLMSGVVMSGQVPYQRLVDAAKEPAAWLTYNGGYFGQRYSALDQLTPANVAGLKPAWVYQVAGNGHGVLAGFVQPQEQCAHAADQKPGVEGLQHRALQLADSLQLADI